jgi:hypothetical protein
MGNVRLISLPPFPGELSERSTIEEAASFVSFIAAGIKAGDFLFVTASLP